MRAHGTLVLFLWAGVLVVIQATPYAPYDDFHYPEEEAAERSSVTFPKVARIGTDWAVLSLGGHEENVTVGAKAFDQFWVSGEGASLC